MPSLTPVASQLGADLIVVCFVACSAVFYHHLYVSDRAPRPLWRTVANKPHRISGEQFIQPSCFYFKISEHNMRRRTEEEAFLIAYTTPKPLEFSAAAAT